MCQGILDDLTAFDIASVTWSIPGNVDGHAPLQRYFHGFAAGDDGLYVHGGSVNGNFYDVLGPSGTQIIA